MTYFHTCVGCKFKGKDCNHLASLKNSLRFTGVTSVKHICKARVPMFALGDQVLIEVFMYDAADSWNYSPVFGKFRGVFIQQKGTKGICFIKPGTVRDGFGEDECDPEDRFSPIRGGNGYVKVRLSRITHIEGAEKLNIDECSYCGQHALLTGVCGCSTEHACRPDKCLIRSQDEQQDIK